MVWAAKPIQAHIFLNIQKWIAASPALRLHPRASEGALPVYLAACGGQEGIHSNRRYSQPWHDIEVADLDILPAPTDNARLHPAVRVYLESLPGRAWF